MSSRRPATASGSTRPTSPSRRRAAGAPTTGRSSLGSGGGGRRSASRPNTASGASGRSSLGATRSTPRGASTASMASAVSAASTPVVAVNLDEDSPARTSPPPATTPTPSPPPETGSRSASAGARSDPGSAGAASTGTGAGAGAGTGAGAGVADLSAHLSRAAATPSANDGSKDSIQVFCRVRPLNAKEQAQADLACVRMPPDNNKSVEVSPPDQYSEPMRFHYDRVFGFDSTQREIYEAVAKPVVEGLFEGYNGTVFAYGQTSSGKTYTMEGPDISDPENMGIVPRIIHTVLDHVRMSPPHVDFQLRVSMVELYLENFRDLLKDGAEAAATMTLRETKNRFFLPDVLEEPVTTAEQVHRLLEKGTRQRVTAATDMNERSSRSHSVFMFHVIQTNLETLSTVRGTLYLVDLAGSEQLKQAQNINLSLLTLGRVISALSERRPGHVPYRESNLTKLLHESIGGNSRTALIINCSPASVNREQTVNTLKFGQRAKKVRNKPKVNKELSPQELKAQLALANEEIRQLKARIRSLGGSDARRTAGGAAVDASALPADAAGVAAELEALRDKYERVMADRVCIEKQLDDMVKDFIGPMNAEKAELEGKVATLQRHAASLEADIQSMKTAETDAADELTVVKQTLSTTTDDLTTARSQLSTLVGELRVVQDSVQEVDVNVVAGEGDADGSAVDAAATADGLDLDTTFEADTLSGPKDLTTEAAITMSLVTFGKLDALAKRATRAEARVDSAESKLDDLQTQNKAVSESLQTTAEALAKAEEAAAQHSTTLADKTAALQAKTHELREVSTQLKELKATATEAEAMVATSEAAAEETARQLAAETAKYNTAQARVHDLQKEVGNLSAKLERTCRKLENAQEEQRQAESLLAAMKASEAETTALDRESRALRSQLDSATASMKTSQRQTEQYAEECHKAREELAEQLLKQERLSEEKFEAETRAVNAERAKTDAVMKAQNAQARLTEAERMLRVGESEVEKLQEELRRLTEDRDQLADSIPEQLKAAEKAVKAKWEEILERELEAKDAELKDAVDHLSAERDAVETAAEEERQALQAELTEVKVQLAAVSERGASAADLEATHRETQDRLRVLETKNRDLKRDAARLRRQRNLAVGEVNNRKLEIDILKSTARALEMRLELVREADQQWLEEARRSRLPSNEETKAEPSATTPAAGAGTSTPTAAVGRATARTPPAPPIHDPTDIPEHLDEAARASWREKMTALEEAQHQWMQRAHTRDQELIGMEERLQRALASLQAQTNQASKYKAALEKAEAQLRLVENRTRQEMTEARSKNHVKEERLEQAEARIEELTREVRQLTEAKTRLELKLVRYKSNAAMSESTSASPWGRASLRGGAYTPLRRETSMRGGNTSPFPSSALEESKAHDGSPSH